MSTRCTLRAADRDPGEARGFALVTALMVALVLVFLGMGLLMQVSLGLQAAGTDRWLVKAAYAADAGVLMQIQMIQEGALSPPGSFILVDDPALEGFLMGEYTVTVDFCETRPISPVLVNGVASSFPEYHVRHFHTESDAERTLGGLAGVSRASMAADVSAYPFLEERFVEVVQCR